MKGEVESVAITGMRVLVRMGGGRWVSLSLGESDGTRTVECKV